MELVEHLNWKASTDGNVVQVSAGESPRKNVHEKRNCARNSPTSNMPQSPDYNQRGARARAVRCAQHLQRALRAHLRSADNPSTALIFTSPLIEKDRVRSRR